VPIVDPHDQKASKPLLKLAQGLSRSRGDEFAFAWLNGPLWHQHIELYALTPGDLPRLLFLNGPTNAFFVCNESIVTPELVTQALDDVLAGRIHLRQSWSDWGKHLMDENGTYLAIGVGALLLICCIGFVIFTGGEDEEDPEKRTLKAEKKES